jgi:hypothetical protein
VLLPSFADLYQPEAWVILDAGVRWAVGQEEAPGTSLAAFPTSRTRDGGRFENPSGPGSGTILLVSIAALFVFQVLNFRSNFQRDSSTLAAVLANQSTAAMQFKDDATAAEVVGALQAKPSVLSASLVLPDGSILAHYGIREQKNALAKFPPPGEYRFISGHLLFVQPVILKQDRVGTLYLRTDYRRTFLELLGFYGQVIAGASCSTRRSTASGDATLIAPAISGRIFSHDHR